ncbi:MAG: UvrABC system protein B [Rhodocyclaceae bacterium]|nr:UvrABC system protein B [Rhodocyclaceae bacterium]
MTDSMRRAIAETERRRARQMLFNEANGITPKSISKRIKDIIDGVYDHEIAVEALEAAEERARYEAMDEKALAREIRRLEKRMQEHARNLEFEEAAAARDELFRLRKRAFGVDEHDAVERKDAA